MDWGGYRNIVEKPYNEIFLTPTISYSIENKNDKILVFNSSWEDRYFLRNWSQRKFNFPTYNILIEPAFKNILDLIEVCKNQKIPCILNFHPHLWLNNRYGITVNPLKLFEKLSKYIKDNKLVVDTFSNIYNEKK